MPDLSRPDARLHYEISGDGPPLLLLAGMLSDSATWAPILPLLEPHFTIIRPDNRTTGRTVANAGPVLVTQMIDDAVALMEHLGQDRFHIAGHSMGGLMGMEIAALHAERVATLSILASGPVRIARGMAMFEALHQIRTSGPKGEETWLRALYPWIFGPEFFETPGNVPAALEAAIAYPYAQTAEGMSQQIEALRGYRPRTRMGDIVCSVQVLQAEEDILIPNVAAADAFQKIKGVEIHMVPKAGHSIVWDAPDTVAARILSFAT